MTGNEQKLLDFLIFYEKENSFPPSYAEMCEHMGMKSKSGPWRVVQQLKEKGLVTQNMHGTRSIVVVKAIADPVYIIAQKVIDSRASDEIDGFVFVSTEILNDLETALVDSD